MPITPIGIFRVSKLKQKEDFKNVKANKKIIIAPLIRNRKRCKERLKKLLEELLKKLNQTKCLKRRYEFIKLIDWKN